MNIDYKTKPINPLKSFKSLEIGNNIDYLNHIIDVKKISKLKINISERNRFRHFETLSNFDFSNTKSLSIELDRNTYSILHINKTPLKPLEQFIQKMDIEYFALDRHTRSDVRFEETQWISKLKGISINVSDTELSSQFNEHISQNIETLTAHACLPENIRGKLANLKELCHGGLSENELKLLLNEDIHNLKRIHMKWIGGCVYYKTEERDRLMQQFLNKIIYQMEYFGLVITVAFNDAVPLGIVDMICLALQNRVDDENKKKRLKIRIEGLKFYDDKNLKNTMDTLQKLMIYLDRKCENWMVICNSIALNGKDKQAQEGMICNYLEGWNNHYNVAGDVVNGSGFVMSNNGCNINGYQEKWIMQCHKCKQVSL